jgi:hypothetical protein
LKIKVGTTDSIPLLPAKDAPDKTSEYIRDLQKLLGRIDDAASYYQILGVESTDGQEEIKSSFQQLLNLLYPPYIISRTLTPKIIARIDRAFNKASQSFGVLAS